MNNERNDGGPAFPQFDIKGEFDYRQEGGLRLRDYMAAKAMLGLYQMIAGRMHEVSRTDPEGDIAKQAYRMADAMLRAREQA
jgi:hypothetical protein